MARWYVHQVVNGDDKGGSVYNTREEAEKARDKFNKKEWLFGGSPDVNEHPYIITRID